MSDVVATHWIPPKARPEILKVDPAFPSLYMTWFVNRRAYTRQSDTPNPDNQRYYYFQPKERLTKRRLALDENAVRKHLGGFQTIGLYAINPESQRSKWVAIDADYDRAHRDLANLRLELKQDGVEAALEMSRRGAHLWILCEEPLPAKDCRMPNGIHAVVIEPELCRVEMFRYENTYDALITKHSISGRQNGTPQLESSIVFFRRAGTLSTELWGKDSAFRGGAMPRFFRRNGEEMLPPESFLDPLLKITEAVCCIGCKHSHLLGLVRMMTTTTTMRPEVLVSA